MKKYFNSQLSIIMIIFALGISITFAIYDYIKIKQQAISHQHNIMVEKANMLLYALETSEKATFLFGDNLTTLMKEHTLYLQSMYETANSFDDWDFQELSKQLGVDIFIIDENNEIIYSNVDKDIGLNFNECCRKLAEVLDERRAIGEFYDDGIDVEQATGIPKKYSYMSTFDKKYIIQLGFTWEKYDIFQYFNFFNVINELVSDEIYDIHVLNLGGIPLGVQTHEHSLTGERRAAFEHTLASGKATTVNGQWNNEDVVYLYVHYSSKYDQGITKDKVLEIIYSQHELNLILEKNKHSFIYQIIIILTITIILATIISRRVAKPIHMAFHDSLTALGNRAFLQEYLEKSLTRQEPVALIMVDVDNFKQVNDSFGHDQGDNLLIMTARMMKEMIADVEAYAFRIGGDEFIIVLHRASPEQVKQLATDLIREFNDQIASQFDMPKSLSLSIGIALAPEHGIDTETITKNADNALYESKKSGKNRYSIYSL